MANCSVEVVIVGHDVELRALRIAELLPERLAGVRGRWPKIQLGDADFAAWLAERIGGDVVELRLQDLFLCCACLRGDRAALHAFESEVLSQVPRWLERFDGASADEVQQALREKLLMGEHPHLLDYGGRGALDRWVRVAATRTTINRRRRAKPVRPDALDDLLASPDPEIDFVKLHDREVLRGVLRDAIRALPARELGLFRLHYLEGVSLNKLAELEHVHRATAARWLAGARAAVFERTHALLRERLKLSPEEGASLIRLVRSRLELSLRSALRDTPPA